MFNPNIVDMLSKIVALKNHLNDILLIYKMLNTRKNGKSVPIDVLKLGVNQIILNVIDR